MKGCDYRLIQILAAMRYLTKTNPGEFKMESKGGGHLVLSQLLFGGNYGRGEWRHWVEVQSVNLDEEIRMSHIGNDIEALNINELKIAA